MNKRQQDLQGCYCSSQKVNCIMWVLKPFTLDSSSNGLKMEIIFKRRLTNELLTTYLPSLLLLLMSYATAHFKPFYFEAAVTVNLSILLVTTTLFIRYLKIRTLQHHWKYYIRIINLSVSWRNFLLLLMSVWLIFGLFLDSSIHLFRDIILL